MYNPIAGMWTTQTAFITEDWYVFLYKKKKKKEIDEVYL